MMQTNAIIRKKPNDFRDVDASKLTLWRVSIKYDDDDDVPIELDSMPEPEKEKLRATSELSDVLKETPLKKTIHITVQRPPPASSTADAVPWRIYGYDMPKTQRLCQGIHGSWDDGSCGPVADTQTRAFKLSLLVLELFLSLLELTELTCSPPS
ncbi:hypothetical protein EC957_009817 [Mortierella hygrophila]|uniref:Crinkler effector protein N-terminal domain-containing protein n=1 Tax=Mortierella hygrophila TaxID=979708 RepID=A0A9P6FBM3_9FUNG|nr:hypothetical protein EC957_009817 [Mortierella hygrophila]